MRLLAWEFTQRAEAAPDEVVVIDSLGEHTAGEVMTPNPITINRDVLAVEALRVMETHKITAVVVVGAENAVEGVVQLHDLWGTQMF